MSEIGSCYYQLYFLYQIYILSSILLDCSTNTLNDMNVYVGVNIVFISSYFP